MPTFSPFVHEAVPEIIAHINDDHPDDVMTLAIYDAKSNNYPTPLSAQLTQIYQEGLELFIKNDKSEYTTVFQFEAPLTDIDDLNRYYVKALKKAGKATGRPYVIDTQDHIVVKEIEKIGNFIRITAILPDDTPTDKAGFAYLFKVSDTEMRYYTLRKAWHDNGQVIGQIDVFTHGDTAGSVWASTIKAGDHLISNRRYPEKTEHLHGQVLLIGDETSLPTVLRILELQTFDKPMVIACLQDTDDEIYLNECQVPFITLSYNEPSELLPKILTVLDEKIAENIQINSVWTAMESALIKQLRKALKTRLSLDKSQMAVKVYWRLD